MFLYYKYVIRTQFLLKYPAKKINNLIKSILKKILFEVNLDNLKKNYIIIFELFVYLFILFFQYEALHFSESGLPVLKTGMAKRRYREFVNLMSCLEDNSAYKGLLRGEITSLEI